MSRLLRSFLVALGVTVFLVLLVSFLVLVGLWFHARSLAADAHSLFVFSGGIREIDIVLPAFAIFVVAFGIAYRRSGSGPGSHVQ